MKILVCDDHALFREGLDLVLGQLEPGAELTSVGDAESALARVAADDALDLVLLDLHMPGIDPADVRVALERGASGFIPKSTRGSVLLGALRLVLAGGIYVPPLMLAASAEKKAGELRAAPTGRQLEVLRLLARGLTNREIAGVLGIAEGTVKTHILHLYETLDVTNRTEAAMRMRELELGE